jgi:hypothetical protein
MEQLVIATTDLPRAEAWRRLLDEVADAQGLAPLPARVTAWAEVLGREAAGPPRPPARAPAAVSDGAPGGLRTADRVLLDFAGRHPFLAPDDLAAALGWAPAATRRRRDALVAAGLLRLLEPAEAVAGGLRPDAAAAGLAELTPAGVALVAARQGLTVGTAARHTGLAGGGPGQRAGTRLSRARYVLLRHLAHTRGADRFFVALARAARAAAVRSPEEAPVGAALAVWRNAFACARGRVHPDGYGVLRRAGRRHGFFLEYDRGTARAGDYRAKLGAYYAYRDSGRYAADYAGFPVVLLVTTDTDAENRIAGYARAAADGAAPLALLLTTEWRFRGAPGRPPDPAGPLGPIWRTPDDPKRRRWP